VRSRDSIVPLKIDDISRFEADDDYVKFMLAIVLPYSSNTFRNRIKARLLALCRVHRSIIVNLEFVERVESQDRRLLIILKDKTEILASRSGSQSLRKLIL
jgi:DNA-binding LytR/AlgR family response regulator